jgi:signal transduction histidine kinase
VKGDASQLIDGAVPVLVGGIVAVGVAVRADAGTRALALALGSAAAAALVLRRREPLATLAVSGGLVLALFAVDHRAGEIAVIAPAAALYSVALTRGRIHLAAAVVAAVAAVVAAHTLLANGHHGLTLQTAAHVALIAIPVLAAEALRNRRSYVQLLLERLELIERTREEEAERRAEQERLRIARDLHDVVAHTLTTINVQAGVAAHLLDRDPSHAHNALATIETASHDALEELRAILGVLRDSRDGDAPIEPSPGLAAVDALIEQVRDTGLQVSFEIEGEQPPAIPEASSLPPSGSCRNRSQTRAATRRERRPVSRSPIGPIDSGWRSKTTEAPPVMATEASPASASPACGSEQRRSVARSKPRLPASASVLSPNCPTAAARDPSPRR